MAPGKKVKNATVGETSKQSTSRTQTPKPLKPEPKIIKKSPSQNNTSAKSSKGPQSNQGKPVKSNNVARKKGEDVANKNKSQKTPVNDKKHEKPKGKIDGMIFMCNAKTKPDCFRYMVMGLPQSKEEIVATIKPGLKLYLYDFDAKLLYGIYEATSVGGMKLEPAAFGGSYPAQVRFKVHVDCLPLSEGMFKKAIMGYSCGDGDKIKFDIGVTKLQVKKLAKLFRPSTQLMSNVNTLVQSAQPVPIPLVQFRPILPAIETPLHIFHPEALAGVQYAQSPSQKETAPVKRETVPHDLLSLSEKEYRTYGLRREPLIPAPATAPSAAPVVGPSHGIRDAHYPYAVPPTRASYLSGKDSQSDLSQRRMDESEYKLRPAAEQLATQSAPYLGYPSGVSRQTEAGYGARLAEADRLHSAHAANALSDYNRSYLQPGGAGDSGNSSVSSRYSFAGPSFTYR
ncbi:uncharacterized protein M6B38_293140 [Iris pallida]|uniref:DCD domain-containing protein n=1 Tax=Iris pallida TaxID=29817 RepID=A0AAX6HUW3_IRIPA|nr:uncharacterized protein M6B38_293140 [Iris pallida]